MTTPESKVKAKVKRMLEPFGAKCYRFMPVQMGFGAPALDFYFCFYGYFIAVETKTRGKLLTDRQKHTRQQIEAADGLVFVVDDEASLQFMVGALMKLIPITPWPKKEKS